MDGIRNHIEPPRSVDKNIFEMSEAERAELGIELLPNNLFEAIKELEKDPLLMDVLGPHLGKNYVHSKKMEWADYCWQVSEWEIEKYLYKI